MKIILALTTLIFGVVGIYWAFRYAQAVVERERRKAAGHK